MDSRLLLFLILKLVKLRSIDIKGTYFTTADYNKFTSVILDAKLREKNLVNKYYTFNLVIISNMTFLISTSNPLTDRPTNH